MFAKFFISGEGNFEEEIGRNFREGRRQVSDASCQEILGSGMAILGGPKRVFSVTRLLPLLLRF